ncbi:alkane hydroxylase MAH1-like [Henckelia pumila]|uniref:alkane hydroxylase MAH1-like n=1 Tax=Henckelia pumila TaxID=405737 RepID=UPI003C6DE4D7
MYVLLIFFSILFLSYYYHLSTKIKRTPPINWPVLGMLPGLLSHRNRVHEFLTDVLRQNGGTFMFKGPWFGNMDMLITCDPANVHYILSKNFPNFTKGRDFREIFEGLGDGIFVAEFESWERQRKICMSLLNQAGFQEFVGRTTWRKVESGLIPILEHFSESGMEVDIQELFQRLSFDCSCILILGHDPASLCIELPYLPEEKAFASSEEAVLRRHTLPGSLWKLERWLQIGKEKKLTEAKKIHDRFLSYCMSLKCQKNDESVQFLTDDNDHDHDLDLLTSYMRLEQAEKGDHSDAPSNIVSEQTWKDTMLNLIFAGKDTVSASLTWFFWLLATNPVVENKIRGEISTNLPVCETGKWQASDADKLKKLVYLHGALCESLRLFPPVGLQHKAPVEPDTLPSGHRIDPNTKTVLSFYSMGRMESIWGRDCLEFNPGRWINSDQGRQRIKTEPSFKFTAFNAGPRSCLGKEMSFLQLKIVAASIIRGFKFDVIKNHPICPSSSVILHMKHGLKMKVSKC